MSARNKSKAKIHMSKPELPPFLQRMKEQIVANEDAERSQRKQKNKARGSGDPDDDPTIVRIGDQDLTEQEYKKLKMELDSQYRLDGDKSRDKTQELDIDALIQSRTETKPPNTKVNKSSKFADRPDKPVDSSGPKSDAKGRTKQLSYGFSSDEDNDDDGE